VIAQIMLSVLMVIVLIYAGIEYARAPSIGFLTILAALCGLYLVWAPEQANALAHFAGVSRGVDLIIYNWVVISFALFLNLHLKLRSQTELITTLVREIAITNALLGKSSASSG
jgi:hypothetical protein